MKFGKMNNPEEIDFSLPPDYLETKALLSKYIKTKTPQIYVGCAKWNRADLKGFYPRGTKDELAYYLTQFNSVELNATFYRIFFADQFATGYDKTPDNFAPKDINKLEPFLKLFPEDVPLAVEFRHTDWYNDPVVASELYAIFEIYNVANIITVTAGRRDLLQMRLTSDTAFIRYNGAKHKSDYTRLDEWVVSLKEWVDEGLQNIYFFVHQNVEKESPLLSADFIKKLNDTFGTNLHIPQIPKK